jgi:F0F1-type ATP synthase membrane subunit c/vacuolar-type H+-ATPase subunit K
MNGSVAKEMHISAVSGWHGSAGTVIIVGTVGAMVVIGSEESVVSVVKAMSQRTPHIFGQMLVTVALVNGLVHMATSMVPHAGTSTHSAMLVVPEANVVVVVAGVSVLLPFWTEAYVKAAFSLPLTVPSSL